METDDMLTITLKLGTRQLNTHIKREEEQIYREAAKLINSRYSFYTNKFPHQKDEVYLKMTALDLAVLYETSEQKEDVSSMLDTLKGLLGEVDTALK